MRLWLFHNGAARIPCEKCKEFVYDLDTGEQQTTQSGPERTRLPLLRGGSPTPCHICPKESPERAKELELTPQNWKAWTFYQEAKATGLSEEERKDQIVRQIFAVLDPIARSFNAKSDSHYVAAELAQIFARLKKP